MYIKLKEKMLKKFIIGILNFFDFVLIKKNSYHSFKTVHNKNFKHLDHLYKKLIKIEKPIIFDVGANLGQSIRHIKLP